MALRKIENKTIEVILLQTDKNLWEKYEVVRVKPIFARNVLLPKKMAVLADAWNKHNFAQKMKAADAERKNKASSLEEVFGKIHNDEWITILRKANKDHTLYAKVDENDIVEKIKEIYWIEIDSHLFKLKKKITALGTYNVAFLYKTIKREIVVKVEQDPEELKKHKETESTGKVEETKEEVKVEKTKDQIKAEKEEKRKIEKIEKIKMLKEKYK